MLDILVNENEMLFLKILPRQLADGCISCLNNALVRFAKQMSFRYLKGFLVRGLSRESETFLRCLNNAFVRYFLDLQKSCLLNILKTSPQDVLLC